MKFMEPIPNSTTKMSMPRGLLLTFALAFSGQAWSQSSSLEEIVSTLYQQLEQQQDQEAYTLGQQHLSQWEGEPSFDLAYGLAAQRVEQCDQAIFALERVVQVVPSRLDARYALASCYYQVGNVSASQQEFKLVLASQPSEPIKTAAQQALNALERQQNASTDGWKNALQLGLGWDSNPNNGVENEFITIPTIGQVRLLDQSREASSGFYELGGHFNYSKQIDQTTSWRAALGASTTDFSDENGLSRTNAHSALSYHSQWREADWSVSAFFRPLWLDSEHFLDYYGTQAQVQSPLNASIDFGAQVLVAKLDYQQLDALSRDQLQLQLFVEGKTMGGISRLSFIAGQENTSEAQYDFNSRSVYGLSYQFRRQLDWQWSMALSVDYLTGDFEQPHPLFAQTRKDDLLQLKSQFYYQWSPDWMLSAQLSWVDNSSNVTLYDYSRSTLWFGARYQF